MVALWNESLSSVAKRPRKVASHGVAGHGPKEPSVPQGTPETRCPQPVSSSNPNGVPESSPGLADGIGLPWVTAAKIYPTLKGLERAVVTNPMSFQFLVLNF